MGNWFLTDYSATVGQILVIFSIDPHEILFPMKCWKVQPPGMCKIRIVHIADFGQFGPILTRLAFHREISNFVGKH